MVTLGGRDPMGGGGNEGFGSQPRRGVPGQRMAPGLCQVAPVFAIEDRGAGWSTSAAARCAERLLAQAPPSANAWG